MLFNSLQFPAFLSCVVGTFFLIPHKFRVSFLLGASYFFYGCWRWEYLVLIIAQTELNFLCGLGLAGNSCRTTKRLYLYSTVGATLLILFVFKYYNFACSSFGVMATHLGFSYRLPVLDALLPVGISFHTFQCLSYNLDLYHGRIQVERNFRRFALYVSFFPLLVAGPIERAGRLIPQFSVVQRLSILNMTSGLRLILWGMFKKVVIADRLAEYVNQIYLTPAAHAGSTLALATVFFTFQIYCDFSGYTDIAIGSARILGFELMENFRLPYLAKSISEFWQRWHISLSTWFRDYVYIPMGGSRVTTMFWARNILATFLLSGLWHGANWTFIVWGGLHGTYFLLERSIGRRCTSIIALLRVPGWLSGFLQVSLTLTMVMFAWVFFRASSVTDALTIVSRIVAPWNGSLYLGSSSVSTIMGVFLIILLVVVQVLQAAERLPLGSLSQVYVSMPIRWMAQLGLLLGIAMLGKSGGDFIYFQF